MNLYNQISNCTFDDIYVGDYILSNQKDAKSNQLKWLIADINNYLNSGYDTVLKSCHVTIIPAGPIIISEMNPTNTTGVIEDLTEDMVGYNKGGYLGSKMKNITLPKILEDYVFKDFQSKHVLKYDNLLTNKIEESFYNRTGNNTGASSSWEYVDSQIDLMSEVNVHGTIIASSSTYDIGIDNEQYAIFRLRPELKYSDGSGNKYWYWLKAVTSAHDFAIVTGFGDTYGTGASRTDGGGVRPRFLIG